MIEEATVDAYNESEQLVGFLSMIEDSLALPFTTRVLDVDVLVERIDMTAANEIVAVCRRGRTRQAIPILELPLPRPAPKGAEWIEAYRRWAKGW
ncbi:MAG: calcium-binding protein [Burkholderiales bacterium]